MELYQKKINVLGDSITEGLKLSDPKDRFTQILMEKSGAVIRNYGISGTRIAIQQVPSSDPREDRYFASRVAEMDPDADVIIVFGGTNDFGHGDAPMGTMNDRTADTFYGGLHVLYRSLIKKYPAARIVVLTPLHRVGEENPRGDGCKKQDAPVLEVYVGIIRQVAAYYSLPILDLYAVSGLQPNVPIIQERYMPDGLHPNEAGHKVLAELIAAFLKSFGETPSSSLNIFEK